MLQTIKLILYYLAYQLAFSGFFTVAYMLLHHMNGIPTMADKGFVLVSITAQLLGTMAMGIHLWAGRYVNLHSPLRSRRPGLLFLTAGVLIVAMGCWTNYLSELFQLPDNMEDVFRAMLNNPIGVASVALFAPLVEEMLFRGGIQGHLTRQWKSPAAGIVVASLIFGVIHGNPVQIPFAFVTGLVLGWVYYRTGSLWPGIWMHFINNASSVAFYHLAAHPDAGMQKELGSIPALTLAMGGFAVSVLCIWLIGKKLTLPVAQDSLT